MKKMILGMLAGCFILAASVNTAKAQISLNVNIGTWTPPAEYADAEYVYLPDVESYYYVPKHQFVYMDGGQWVFRNSLPPRYSNYNINNGYKVIVNRPQAYRYFNTDRTRYAHYRGNSGQVIVRGNSYNVHNRTVVHNTRIVNRGGEPGPGNKLSRGNGRGPGGEHGNGRGPGGEHGNGGHGKGGEHGGGHGHH